MTIAGTSSPAPSVVRPLAASFHLLLLLMLSSLISACGPGGRRDRVARSERSTVEGQAPYQAEVEEGLGAAVAILIDTSRSMRERAPGDARPKYVAAREALEAMLDATDAFVARRPDFPIKIGVYTFSRTISTQLPIRRYDRAAVRDALARLPVPNGDTAIGDALHAARPDLYRAGAFRKYLLVVTDGENTRGRNPEDVSREIFRKSEGAVQIYFVAFDTSPEKFAFLKETGGDVIGAGDARELRTALDRIYQGRILAEALDAGEREPQRR